MWRKKKCECIVGSHRFFQARVGQNVSCLCQQWSAPEGCDCWAFFHSGGGVSSAWLPAPCRADPPSAGLKPPCCLSPCLSHTKTGPEIHTDRKNQSYVWWHWKLYYQNVIYLTHHNATLEMQLRWCGHEMSFQMWFMCVLKNMYLQFPLYCWPSYPAWLCHWVYSSVVQINCVVTM